MLGKEATVSVFTLPDISTSDWCGGCGGFGDSLDCDTPGSPWHHFLCSPEIFLTDVKGCETPGIYE